MSLITRVIKTNLGTMGEWHVRKSYKAPTPYGKPNAENLQKFVDAYHDSLKGVNKHLVREGYPLPLITWVEVYNQKTGNVEATWQAPAFAEVA